MASISISQNESATPSSGSMATSRQLPSQDGGAACEPSPALVLLSVIEQLRSNGFLPVLVVPFGTFPLPMCPIQRRLSLPSDNPDRLAEILALRQAPAPIVAPDVATATASDIPRTAGGMSAPVSGHPHPHRPDTQRTPQPSDVLQEQPFFREDITPSSPTESWAEGAWGTLRDWDPPRSYH